MNATILIMKLDPNGVPRAWATGPESEEVEVRALADRNLEIYRERKREVNDPLAVAVFTEKVCLADEAGWEQA